jgi:hypothetical protein
MNRSTMLSLTSIAALCLAIALPAGEVVAQQKQTISFKASSANSKYTQQLNIEAENAPNHIVRVFELHRTPDTPPVINGLKLVDNWSRGLTDLSEGNGSATVYGVFVAENGDKFFSRGTLVILSSSGKLTATLAGYITGGTGKFAGMQGSVRDVTNFDLKSGFNEGQTDIEYSFGK